VTWAAPGPALQLLDVAEYFGVGSFTSEIPAEEVLLLARFEMRNTLRPGVNTLCGGLQGGSLVPRMLENWVGG
jgi:hypothetical protein